MFGYILFMNDQQRVYHLVVLMANKETSPEDRKLYYENALHIVRNPTAKPKRIKPTTFLEFWSAYPLKVAKEPAEKAYIKALTVTDHQTIMKGLRWYCLNKEDGISFAHAATWLNQARYNDGQAEIEKAAPVIDTSDWPWWKLKLSESLSVAAVSNWFKDTIAEPANGIPFGVLIVPKSSYQWIKDRYSLELNKIFGNVEIRVK